MPKALRFISGFAWCIALVRGGFALSASPYVNRFVHPWPKILRDVVQGLLYFGAALVALRAVGVEPSSLLTTSALLTAVVGFSLQETLGNLFAGLALQSQETLVVGDWVRFADGADGVGQVTEINWRATHFVTNAHVQVVVPNGVLARATVRNYSRPTSVVRAETEVTLPYELSPERARSVLLGALRGADGVLAEPPPSIILGNFGDAGVHYHVRYFLHDYGRRDAIESGVRQRLFYALKRGNIDLPFPHRQLEIVGPPAPKLDDTIRSEAPPADRTEDIARRLTRTHVFRELDRAILRRLATDVQPMLYAPGESIIRQGEADTDLYVLETGRVEVFVGADHGSNPVRATYLEPGALFGEAAFMSGGRRATTIVALTECEVLSNPPQRPPPPPRQAPFPRKQPHEPPRRTHGPPQPRPQRRRRSRARSRSQKRFAHRANTAIFRELTRDCVTGSRIRGGIYRKGEGRKRAEDGSGSGADAGAGVGLTRERERGGVTEWARRGIERERERRRAERARTGSGAEAGVGFRASSPESRGVLCQFTPCGASPVRHSVYPRMGWLATGQASEAGDRQFSCQSELRLGRPSP